VNRVIISQIAIVTALGDGLNPLWQNLLEGKSGIAPVTRFDCKNYISNYAACIDHLEAPSNGSLLDSVLERIAGQVGDLPNDCRLLMASTKGEIDRLTTVCQRHDQIPPGVLATPLLDKVSRQFGITAGAININAACASSTLAVARAAAQIAAGHAAAVFVYAADLVSEFVFSGFSSLQALSDQPCRPFDCHRNGLTLGEAGVAILLLSEAAAQKRHEAPLAYVSGWGMANDAHHVTAPARDGNGLILACREALATGGIKPMDIAAINAHGTGTIYNDAMELTAFNAIFEDSLPPLHGVKGSLGHCLGAAGGVEIALGCQALQQQIIPPTVGCQDAEIEAQGRIKATPQEIKGDYLLCTNSGFGGINAAVILQGVA